MRQQTGTRGTGRRQLGRLLLFACAGLVLACARPTRTLPRGFIQVDIETSPLTLDPRLATDAISARIDELVFDSLLRLDRDDRYISGLAESVERPAPDRLVFHLRRGLRFADGRQLTARDVEYTYNSVVDSRSLSPKRAALAEIESVAAPDDLTFVMTTRGSYAPALEMALLGVVPYGSALARRSRLVAPPGSGAFRVVDFTRDERVVLARNLKNATDDTGPRAIVFKVVPDPTVRALELAAGVCDFAENNIQPDLLGYLSARPNLRVERSPGTAYQYLAFNFRDPALRDLRVRRAIAYAIDREAIVVHFMRGAARPATGMLSPENWAYEGDVMRYRYDPAKAAELLHEAGYPAAPDGRRRLSFVYKTTPEGRRLGEIFQAMLARVGIRLEVRTNEWATFYADVQKGNFDLTSLDWVGITDPHHYYMVFDSKMTPPRGLNRGAYANPQMDRLLEAGEVTLDAASRRRLYGQVQKLAASDLPYLSLWWQDNVAVMNRGLVGFTPYPNGSLRSLADVTLTGRIARLAPRD